MAEAFSKDGLLQLAKCACGCGDRVRRAGLRFIHNHHRRKSGVEYLVNEKTGCWDWQRAKVPDGYGSVGVGNRKVRRAHQVYYERFYGPVPSGFELHHRCENRGCCNPHHLELLTRKTHRRKGRHLKLSPDKARAIRTSTASQNELAKKYGVTQATISAVQNGKIWT